MSVSKDELRARIREMQNRIEAQQASFEELFDFVYWYIIYLQEENNYFRALADERGDRIEALEKQLEATRAALEALKGSGEKDKGRLSVIVASGLAGLAAVAGFSGYTIKDMIQPNEPLAPLVCTLNVQDSNWLGIAPAAGNTGTQDRPASDRSSAAESASVFEEGTPIPLVEVKAGIGGPQVEPMGPTAHAGVTMGGQAPESIHFEDDARGAGPSVPEGMHEGAMTTDRLSGDTAAFQDPTETEDSLFGADGSLTIDPLSSGEARRVMGTLTIKNESTRSVQGVASRNRLPRAVEIRPGGVGTVHSSPSGRVEASSAGAQPWYLVIEPVPPIEG